MPQIINVMSVLKSDPATSLRDFQGKKHSVVGAHSCAPLQMYKQFGIIYFLEVTNRSAKATATTGYAYTQNQTELAKPYIWAK